MAGYTEPKPDQRAPNDNGQPGWSKRKEGKNKPSKLMTPFPGPPSSSSCLFEARSFRAILRTLFLFHRSLFIPGSLELLNNHVINPGNRPEMNMQNTRNREGFPKDEKLTSRAGVSVTGDSDCELRRWVAAH